jgi:two-component system, OmpR family, alkaline phosphatase synthesis response regulator PhoP
VKNLTNARGRERPTVKFALPSFQRCDLELLESPGSSVESRVHRSDHVPVPDRGAAVAKGTILIVDDEPDIVEVVRFNLSREGYRVHTASTGEQALLDIRKVRPDLVVLDLMLPGIDGLEVCKRLRAAAETAQLPVLMVTAKSEDADIVTGLEIGADDYVTKPFSPRVLLARIKSLLHKTRTAAAKSEGKTLTVGLITLQLAEHVCRVGGKQVDLTVTEFRILLSLMRRSGWVFSRDQIVEASRGENTVVTLRSVDVHIVRLRQKLGASGDYIETVRGIGYRLRAPDDAD